MLRKPKSVLNSLICKLPNLLCPSRQILRQTMGCLLGALLWKSPYEQFLNNFYPPAANPAPPSPRTIALRWLMALGRMGKESEQEGLAGSQLSLSSVEMSLPRHEALGMTMTLHFPHSFSFCHGDGWGLI